MSALAEVTWSPKDARNFDDFTRRLKTDDQRLDQLGVNYRLYRPDSMNANRRLDTGAN